MSKPYRGACDLESISPQSIDRVGCGGSLCDDHTAAKPQSPLIEDAVRHG